METVLSVCLGIGLSAACGFRVFVPLLVVGLGARSGHLSLSSGTAWLASDPALLTFGVAALLEISAYYVPWVDHLLDALASPSAVIAGVLVSGSVFTGMDPWLRWTLAAIAGGGVAGVVQALTTGTRLVSTLKTLGVGNPVFATVESAGSLTLSVLAVLAPVLAATIAVAIVAGVVWLARRVLLRA